jgi:vacuolar protein sorting-associated protein 29
MSSFGELVLVLGDMHIPERASKIAAPIQRMLVPNKMQHVICTGNVSPQSLQELQQLAPNLHCVAGDYDLDSPFPETQIVHVGAFRIGVVHGHQLMPWKSNRRDAVQRMRRKLQVDVLITGHTHRSEVVVEDDGFCHINPVRILM